ncbi:MAG: hypothetical protein ACYC64_14255 [Armatimonadota bacterium]
MGNLYTKQVRCILGFMLCVAMAVAMPSISFCADTTSQFVSLASDTYVSSNNQTILTQSITLSESKTVFVQADGRYYPSGAATSSMYISIDGTGYGSSSTMNWADSTNPCQHSFNCIAAVTLAAGTHTINLEAYRNNGVAFIVGANSGMSIVVNPASTVNVATLASDTGVYNFTTLNIPQGSALPHTSMIGITTNNSSGRIVALGSGRMYRDSNYSGDAMIGIYYDGYSLPTSCATLSVNDLYQGAETQAPFYCQASIETTGSHTLSLDATEFGWTGQGAEDPVRYRVGAASTLITMNGGMTVSGSAPLDNLTNYWADYWPLASSQIPTPQYYAAMGAGKVITSATVNIPAGHNGVVMFMGKTRLQADASDGGGTVFLYVAIDGVGLGTCGVQTIAYPNGESQRTICCSYLAAGANALSVGNHTVQLIGMATGSFLHLCDVGDVPLIWFD